MLALPMALQKTSQGNSQMSGDRYYSLQLYTYSSCMQTCPTQKKDNGIFAFSSLAVLMKRLF